MILLLLGCVAKPPAALRPTAPLRSPVAVEVQGSWEGTLNTPSGPVKLLCVIGESTSLTARGLTLPAEMSRAGSSVEVRVQQAGLRLTGTVTGNTWWATWSQGSTSLPVEMHRSRD